MSQYDPLFAAAEQKYGLPPNILKATGYVESGLNPNAVSPTGVRGLMQIDGANAKAFGGNRLDPAQAIDMAGQLWAQNLKATGGDIDAAAVRYNGGGDPHYVQKLTNYLQSAGQPSPQPAAQPASDPYEQALSGGPSKSAPVHAASSDPFEAALQGGNGGGNVGLSVPTAQEAGLGAGGISGGVPGGAPAVQAGQATPAVVGSVPAQTPADPGRTGLGGTGAAPDTSGFAGYGIADNLRGKLESINDATIGVGRGLGSMVGTVSNLIGRGLDATGLTHGAAANALQTNDALQALLAKGQFNPDGGANIAGNIISSLPLAEVKALQAAPEAGALVRALKYGMQGGVIGGALSGGHDIGKNALEGAGWGIGGGALGEGIAATGSRLAKTETGQRLIAALMKGPQEAAPAVDPEAAYAARTEQTVARPGETMEAYRARVDQQEAAMDAESAARRQADPSAPLEVNVVGGGAPDAAPTALDLPTALRAAGSRNGIEATTDLPAQVAKDAGDLKAQGVPDDHALNEASIRYVGGEPTVGTVTRDRAAMQAEKEGAKVTSPEGAALAARAAQNNAALHDTVTQTVGDYGGVPQEGTATQGAAQSLANAGDAEQKGVTAAYTAARATDGDQRVGIDALTNLLSTPDYKFAVTGEGRQLVSGLRGQIKAMSEANGGQFSPEEIDKLSQAANRAYNPMGGGANHMIGEIKGALNQSLDQFDNAGGAFRNARALHRQLAEKYSDPAGIAKLIERDANGNFTNEGGWRAAEGNLIGGAATDKAFGQVVRQLQANGDTQALDRLKAQVVQGAYQKATNTAADELGNPGFSAKQWHTELNKIGMDNLRTLFSKDEIAHLATVGRAARALHESVPGTVNGPGTSSALINALRSVGVKGEKGGLGGAVGRTILHTVMAPIPGGHLAAEAVSSGVGKVAAGRSGKAAQATLAKAIRETMDPALARSAANENAAAAGSLAQRRALANALGRRAATAAASSKGNR